MAVLPTNPRRRNLLLLGGAAVVMLLLALIAVWRQSSSGVSSAETPFFPGLASKIAHHEAARIRIQSKANGIIDVVFKPQSGWVIASRDDFPASFEQVNATLVGLAAMQIVEAKTARADRLSYLGLVAPPQGDGVLLTVSNDKGETIASLIAGKTTDIGDSTGATGLYVRKPSGNQTWLARSVAEIRSGVTDWMEKTVMDVDRARIQDAAMTPAQGPAYTVQRAKPSDADFTLSPIPPGREVSDPTIADGAADSIVGFSFDDAKHASEVDFTGAAKLVTRTFDGLTVTVSTVKTPAGYWATVSAEAVPGKPDAAKEARDINAKASGWAYKLADFKGAQFTTPLENLLKPKGPPVKTAP